MCVDVDGVKVNYYNDPFKFCYHFYTSFETLDNSRKAIDKVIRALIKQSYDHGQVWRIVDWTGNSENMERFEQYEITVKFRTKDSY